MSRLATAKDLLHQGRLDLAARLYEQVLLDDPESLAALNNLGTIREAQDRNADAVELYRRALELAPDNADLRYNLGHALQRLGRLDDAIEVYREVLETDPESLAAVYNLALALHERGDVGPARASYERALAIDPDLLPAQSNLGTLHFELSEFPAASEAYRRAVAIDPDNPEGRFNLGKVLDVSGRLDEADAEYRRSLELNPDSRVVRLHLAALQQGRGAHDAAIETIRELQRRHPDDPIALHTMAAFTGAEVPSRASDDYVRATFDEFAADFDRTLQRLRYNAPQQLAARVEAIRAGGDEPPPVVLDAGCGTGLCGPLLRRSAGRLIGVDLSSGMLLRAEAREVYDELVEQELAEHLRSSVARYDLIVAADTLNYFGALEPVIAAAALALRPRGRLLFTVERRSAGADHRLEPHGRYSHTECYVRRVIREAGLELNALDEVQLRHEGGEPVIGFLVDAGHQSKR